MAKIQIVCFVLGFAAFAACAKLHHIAKHSKRVVGGVDVEACSHRYFVLMSHKDYGYLCSGSWIGGPWVLTSALCVVLIKPYLNDMKIEVGATSTLSDLSYKIAMVALHGNYDELNQNPADHNIALIKLNKPIVSTACIQPINITTTEAKPGDKATFVGVEINLKGPVLKRANVDIIQRQDCLNYYQSLFTDNLICGRNGGVCYSDFGASLIVNNAIVGIFSFVPSCTQNKPDGFLNVVKYSSWIKETMVRYY